MRGGHRGVAGGECPGGASPDPLAYTGTGLRGPLALGGLLVLLGVLIVVVVRRRRSSVVDGER